MKTFIFITVDTETSMGGAWNQLRYEPLDLDTCVLCKLTDGSEYGVGLIMNILDRYGLKGIFFSDIADSHLHDSSSYSSICERILSRGHDLQLHLHPVKMHYFNLRKEGPIFCKPDDICDILSAHSGQEQANLIENAVRIFKSRTGHPPVAFRAGCYGADYTTIGILSRFGIMADFSLNIAYPHNSHNLTDVGNKAFRLNNLLEVPVTQLIGNRLVGKGYRPLEINALSSKEMCNALLQLHAGGQRSASIVFHSFCFLKHRSGRWERIKPDGIVIRRFEAVAQFLAKSSDKFKVIKISEHIKDERWIKYVVGGSEVWPTTTWPLLIYRHIEQLISRMS